MTWTIMDKTTPSGRSLFECSGCGAESYAPTKRHECKPMAGRITGVTAPPRNAIDAAIASAIRSPCAKSQRGASIWSGGRVLAHGHNAQPSGFTCDGSAACRRHCGKLCEHAEAAAIRQLSMAAGHELDMLHVKVVDDGLVPSGPPSCWQCSRTILATGSIRWMWLYHEHGWRRYSSTLFHATTLRECGLMPGDDRRPTRQRDTRPKLTARQRELLEHARTYIAEHGYAPSFRELGDLMGISSTNGITDHIRALIRKGYMEQARGMSRALRILE